MKILSDFHIHTCFCDGKDTPEDIVIEAISKGMKKIGFSGHSYTSFDEVVCMSPETTEKYKNEIKKLKEIYKSEIEILCGIEQDYFSDLPAEGFDFVIGSVHYVKHDGKYLPVDHSEKHFVEAVREFNGDVYKFAEEYFAEVSDVVNKTGASIIGHFDLISKFNDGNKFFEEDNPRYLNAAQKAVDELLKTEKPFEINTGAISRGYKKLPYPSMKILKYIAAHGGKVILSSDAHSKSNLMYEFEKCEKIAEDLGLEIIEL